MLGHVVRNLILGVFAASCLYPLVLIVSTAVKDPYDVAGDPFALFTSVNLTQNFRDAWEIAGFSRYFMNTVIITVPTVLGVVLLSVIAGYALARLEFPGRNIVFYLFILGLMIPFYSIMIPLYYELRDLNLLDTLPGVIFPQIAGATGAGLPLGVFMMRSFFLDLPNELADAARVDGASEYRLFRYVMLPLAFPAAAVVAVLAFVQAWNNFILPLIYLQGEENRTLATGVYFFASGRTSETELLAAGALIMAVPVVIFFMIFQRQLIRGLTAGALKG